MPDRALAMRAIVARNSISTSITRSGDDLRSERSIPDAAEKTARPVAEPRGPRPPATFRSQVRKRVQQASPGGEAKSPRVRQGVRTKSPGCPVEAHAVLAPLPRLSEDFFHSVPHSDMDHRLGDEVERMTGELDPQAVVRVLQIAKCLIESAHRIMEPSLDADRPAPRVRQVGWIRDALQALALGMDSDDRRVIQFAEIDPAGDEIVLAESLSHGTQPSGRHLVVGIAEDDGVAGRLTDTTIQRVATAQALVGRDVMEAIDPVLVLPDDGGRVVGRMVIHDDDLEAVRPLLRA